MARNIKLLVLFTCVHGVITLGCAVYNMAVSSAQFDNPELPRTFLASAVEGTANALMLPARLAWTSWASKHLPNFLEWLLFVANSALWGLVGVAVTNAISSRRHRRQVAQVL
jgi:hypothetical protein